MNSMARSHSAALLHGSTCNIRPGSPHLATVCIAQPLSFVGPKPTTLTASVRQAGMLSVEVCGQRNPSAPSSQRGMPVPMWLHGASAIPITRNSARCPPPQPTASNRELYLSNDERAVAPLQQSERIRGAPIARRLDRAAAACWRSRGSPRMAGINPRRRNASPVTVVRGAKWHLVVVVHRGAAVDSNVEGLNQREERRNSCGIFLFATSLPSTCRTPKQPGFGSASFRLAIRRRASYGGRRAGHAMLGRGRRRSDRCASAFPL